MNELVEHGNPQNWYLVLSTILFSIGVMGVLFRRNGLIILMCVELMLNSVNLLLVSFSAYSGNTEGQVFVFFIMVVAAAEVAVGLALLVSIYRNLASTDINILSKLKW
ncbi:MAG: NADH-quinone oxidoreductase subunit NuoK [Bacteroidia bacterium]|nr:NADH-quinone oxidoreductase subunit NuoK [Bacteroidia bacterium]MCF8427737.1 NADH-quinone oxidoreductase subunit NuoK [Bacteroidia bacterium]MCF8446377.1 NADH-quinone oxidoreductase subunit NuoK [Bacteroidia bacterium]